jgi:tape measure domain-containing protein
MTPAIKSMMSGMNSMIAGFERMESASQGAIDTKSLSAARSEMSKAGAAFQQFEKSVKEAENGQKSFNSTAKASTSSMGGLITKVGALAAGYMSLQAVGNFIGMSDGYSQTTARLGLMNDGLQTTGELQTDIFNAANDSRAPYQAMADMVGKMGILAKDAFSTNDEAVEFAEQISKQFVISGTSAQGAEAATLQLTQAMGSGVLRGEELNSVFEQAPTIIQSIADYLGIPIGQIRAMAQEGEITADIVKESMFKAANATDAKFEAMGLTFGQAWTIFQNKSNRAFQGVFTQMGQLANSDELDGFLDGLAGGVETAASIVSTIGNISTQPFMQELITDVGTGFSTAQDNFSTAWSGFVAQVTTDAPIISANFSGMLGSWEKFFGIMSGDLANFDWGQMGEGFGTLFGYWVQVETGAAGAVASVAAGFDSLMNLYWGVTNQDWLGASESFNNYVRSIADGIKNLLAIFVGQDRAGDIIGEQWLEFGKGSADMLASGMEMNRSGVETASSYLLSSATTRNRWRFRKCW